MTTGKDGLAGRTPMTISRRSEGSTLSRFDCQNTGHPVASVLLLKYVAPVRVRPPGPPSEYVGIKIGSYW